MHSFALSIRRSGASSAPAKVHSDHFCQKMESLPAEPAQGPGPRAWPLTSIYILLLSLFIWFQIWIPPNPKLGSL